MTGRRDKWRWVFGLGLVAIAAAAFLVISVATRGGIEKGDNTASIVSALVALATLALTALTLYRQRPPVRTVSEEAHAAQLAQQLARTVKTLSTQEEEHRRIDDPRPLSVQWHAASKGLVDHWRNIRGAMGNGDSGFEPRSLTGHFSSVGETYAAVPSGRLVILGRAGAGKTVLAHRLILELLEAEDDASPERVPVLFSLSNWNPTQLLLRDWLVTQLARDYPYLDDQGPTGKKGAATLVDNDRILPVLDGFDEIPNPYQSDAVTEISRGSGPLVVTSRTEQYAHATDATRPLGSAAAIELTDLTFDEAKQYLQASSSKTRADQWDSVFEHIRSEPSDPTSQNIAAVLTAPLGVMLARTSYNDTSDHSPAELVDPGRYPTRSVLEDHLFSSYLTTLYDPRRTASTTQPTWNPQQAQYWLGTLANHLIALDSHELTWWQLGSIPRRTTRVLAITFLFGLIGALGFAMLVGFTAPVDMSAAALSSALALGLGTGFGAGLVAGLINEAGLRRRQPERLRLRLHLRNTAKSTGFTDIKKAVGEFATGLAIGLVIALMFAVVPGVVRGSVNRFAHELTDALPIGFASGLAFGLANLVVLTLGANHDPHNAVTPWQLLTTDRTVTLVRTTLVALAVGFLVGFVVFDNAPGLAEKLSIGLMAGSAAGLVRLPRSAWGNWLVFARLWLPLTGRLPWRPKHFLEDAYRKGVLRQTGATYQFRHARLREHLARHHQTTTHRYAPPGRESSPAAVDL